ncbi:MAG: ComEC/Rec2 family competence protein, partial [Verrucomicrobiae bacterium]|nr:ComEC/Rec2 family competence protein [Verrucomicrobiae bacterium]
VYHFQIITPMAVPANLLMVPVATVVLTGGILGWLLSMLGGSAIAGSVVNPCNALAVRLMTAMAGWFANAPGSFVHLSTDGHASALQPGSGRLVVYEPSIGGLSAMLSTSSEAGGLQHWLIDPGDPIGFSSAGQPLLRHLGINRLQSLVLTHGDFDHIGSAPSLILRYRPDAIVDGPFDSRSSTYPRILASLESAGSSHLRVAEGDRFALGGDTEVTVLYPPRDSDPPSIADDRCLVLRIRHRDWRILLTSDSGFLTEKWLLAHQRNGLAAEVWIKGWHGSDASGLTEFLDQVKPAAVITTNHDFPSRERITEAWRDEVAARGAELFDLGESGAVVIRWNDDRLEILPQAYGRPPLILSRQTAGAAQKSR